MIERQGLRLTWVLLASALTGCLPDPPVYDACVNDESQYFTASPKGCNGHELTTLWEQQVEVTQRSIYQTAASYLPPKLVLGADAVYWAEQWGTVLRADLRSGQTQVLFESPADNSAVLGFDPTSNRLYVGVLVADDPANRVSSRIIGIDVATREARILVDLADVAMTNVGVTGDRFYLTNAFGSTLFTGPLDWDSVASTSNLQACTSLESAVSRSFFGVGSILCYVDAEQSSLVAIELSDCSTVSVVANVSGTMLTAAEGPLHLLVCDGGNGCEVVRIALDGTREPIGQTRFSSGYASDAAYTAGKIYAIASLDQSLVQPPRLYVWSSDPSSPVALAAPFGGSNTFAVDTGYVYVLQQTWDGADSVLEGKRALSIQRLLRVKR